MDEFPTPLLKLTSDDISRDMLLVFGESPNIVERCIKEAGYDLIKQLHEREFHRYKATKAGNSFQVIVAGVGSASVECVLAEVSLKSLDKTRVHINGSCGASPDYQLGEPILIREAVPNNGGSQTFYSMDGKPAYPSEDLLMKARKYLDIKEGVMTSSDAFYGYGGILCMNPETKKDELVYSGPVQKDGSIPSGFQKFSKQYEDFKNNGVPYLIDMETAFIYALAEKFSGLEALVIKSPSNHVPFNPLNIIDRHDEDIALKSCIQTTLQLIESYQN